MTSQLQHDYIFYNIFHMDQKIYIYKNTYLYHRRYRQVVRPHLVPGTTTIGFGQIYGNNAGFSNGANTKMNNSTSEEINAQTQIFLFFFFCFPLVESIWDKTVKTISSTANSNSPRKKEHQTQCILITMKPVTIILEDGESSVE